MKKTITIILLILIFLFIFFLQSNFFNWFTIAGIKPNLFIILVLFIGLFIGKKIGFIFGILFGLFIDIVMSQSLGLTSMMLGIVGLLGEYFDKSFSKDNKLTIMLTVAGSTLIYEIGMYILKIIKWNVPIELLPFLKIVMIEMLYNIILIILLYPLIRKSGEYLEETFKNKAILTKYFNI